MLRWKPEDTNTSLGTAYSGFEANFSVPGTDRVNVERSATGIEY